jgi:hypothetical protein
VVRKSKRSAVQFKRTEYVSGKNVDPEHRDEEFYKKAGAAHRQYYAQFVTKSVKELVAASRWVQDGVRFIVSTRKYDPDLKSIAQRSAWHEFHEPILEECSTMVLVAKKGSGGTNESVVTRGDTCGIAKEAVRQLIEDEGGDAHYR